jgi:hypothetical protein
MHNTCPLPCITIDDKNLPNSTLIGLPLVNQYAYIYRLRKGDGGIASIYDRRAFLTNLAVDLRAAGRVSDLSKRLSPWSDRKISSV